MPQSLDYITQLGICSGSAQCASLYTDGTYLYAGLRDPVGANGGLVAMSFDGSVITEIDRVTESNCQGSAAYANGLIFTTTVSGLKAFSFDGVSLTQVGTTLTTGFTNVRCTAWYDTSTSKWIVHLPVANSGLKAYSFDGTTWTLLDSIHNGNNYEMAHTIDGTNIWVGTSSSGDVFLHTWNGSSYSYVDNFGQCTEVYANGDRAACITPLNVLENDGGSIASIGNDTATAHCCGWFGDVIYTAYQSTMKAYLFVDDTLSLEDTEVATGTHSFGATQSVEICKIGNYIFVSDNTYGVSVFKSTILDPIAFFTVNPSSGKVPLNSMFTNLSEGE